MWARGAAGGDSARQIASSIGYSPSSVAKWFRTGRPPSRAVVALARAYGGDIVVGLVCAGIMTMDDVTSGAEGRLRFVPTGLLLAEVAQRGQQAPEDFTPDAELQWGGHA